MNKILCAQYSGETNGHFLQQLVADLMAKGVVDSFEVIQIEKDDADLALPATARSSETATSATAQEPGREDIVAALERNGGVLAQAACDLGLSRQALYRRMERHGITRSGGGD